MSCSKSVNIAFVEFCAGIGGFRLALERLGYECTYSCEIDSKCEDTYKFNFGSCFDSRDIKEVDPNLVPEYDVFCSGFPCQPFSIAGKREGLCDPRGTIFDHILRMIAINRPQVVFLENVRNLVSHGNGGTYKSMLEELRRIGYFVKWAVIDSKYYGVPQSRRRLYLVGFRSEKYFDRFEFPLRNTVSVVVKDILEYGKCEQPISSRWQEYIELYSGKKALREMSFVVPKTRTRLERFMKGASLEDCVLQMRSSGIRAIPINEPFPTFAVSVSGGGAMIPIYVRERRHLNLGEMKKLMGFPADFRFKVARTHAIKQLANAVCPPVIEEIGNQILQALQGTTDTFCRQYSLWSE